MKNDPPSWDEGLFLMPQHLRQQERYFEELASFNAQLMEPYYWGVRELEIDPERLENGVFRVNRVSGRTKTGSVFSFGMAGDIPNQVLSPETQPEVWDRLVRGEAILACLVLPSHRSGAPGIVAGGPSWYREYVQPPDELRSVSPASIKLKRVVPQIRFDPVASDDYDLVPLAKLVLEGQKLKTASKYLPPCLIIQAISYGSKLIKAMEHRLSSHLRKFSEQESATGFPASLLEQGDQAQLYHCYQALSVLRATLSGMSSLIGIHPRCLYLELVRAVGSLVMIDPQGELLPEIPTYDHENPIDSIETLWRIVERSFIDPGMSRIREIQLRAEKTMGSSYYPGYYSARIDKRFFEDNWRIYGGLNLAKLSRDEQQQFLGRDGNSGLFFDDDACLWKLGSRERLDGIYSDREAGVRFVNVAKSKELLPQRSGWFYYDICSDRFWDEVKASGVIGLRVDAGEIATTISDSSRRTIVLRIGDRTFRLGLSLWAVKVA